MKVKGDYLDVPGYWIDDPQSPDGKRWIATHYGWDRIKELVRVEAKGRCELNLAIDCSGQSLDTHHRRGRGGGKRDDRIYIKGIRNLLAGCRPCHQLARIERKEEIYATASA